MIKRVMTKFFNYVMTFCIEVLNKIDPIDLPTEEELNNFIEKFEEEKKEKSIAGISSIKEFNEEVLLCTEEYLRAIQEKDMKAIAQYAKVITYLDQMAKMINDFDSYELN